MALRALSRCGGVALMICAQQAAAQEPSFVRDGTAGFVVSHIEYGLSLDAEETGACPAGMSL